MSLTFKCMNYITYYKSEWLYIFVLWDRDLFQLLILTQITKNAWLFMNMKVSYIVYKKSPLEHTVEVYDYFCTIGKWARA